MPVTTITGAPARGAGPTRTSAWSSGSYQCTPAGTPDPSGAATYSSSGNRPPARSSGAEQPGPGRPLHRAHHASGQVEQARKGGQVKLPRSDTCRSGQYRGGRSRRGPKVAGKRHPRERLGVPLVEPREPRLVVGLQINHAGIIDRRRPVLVRLGSLPLIPADVI